MRINFLATVNPTTVSGFNNFLTVAAAIGGTVVAIIMVVSIVQTAIGVLRGSSKDSIWKLAGQVGFLILCIGFIFTALGWQDLGTKGQAAADGAIKILNENIVRPAANGTGK